MRKIVLAAAAGILLISLSACSTAHLSNSNDDKAAATNAAKPAAAKVGTRANPAPAGSVVAVESASGAPQYKVTLGTVVLNASAQIAQANQFNDAAPAGMQYLLVPVTYEYIGADKGTPWVDVAIEYVSADGKTYTSSDHNVVLDNDAMSINTLYAGAKATGNVAIAVPTADIEKGAFTVGSTFGDPFFVKID